MNSTDNSERAVAAGATGSVRRRHEWRSENRRAIDKLHPGNRLRLMARLPLLPDDSQNDHEDYKTHFKT